MNKIIEWKRKHVICFTIAVILIFELLTRAGIAVAEHFGIINRNTNMGYMLLELIVFMVAIGMLWGTSQTHILKCGIKGLGKGLWSGAVFFVYAVVGCAVFIFEGAQRGVTYKTLPEIVAFIIFVLLVGFAEEILFRGVIADSIFRRFGSSVSGVVLSVMLGGVAFGMTHITNVISGQTLEKTIIQVITVSMTGILLTAIYIRHNNIFVVAILHAVLDFFTIFERGFFEGYTFQYNMQVDIDFWASLRQGIISQSFFVIVAIFLLRPSVIKKMVHSVESGKTE